MEGQEAVNSVSEIVEAIRWIFVNGWNLLSSIKIPGLGVSFATLFIGLLLADLGLRFLFMMIGVSLGPDDINRAESSGLIKTRHSRDVEREVRFGRRSKL